MGAAKKLAITPDQQYLEKGLREGWITVQEISMKAIVVDTSFQARVNPIDMDHVKKLAGIRDINNGEFLGPIVVFLTPEGRFLLADGFHRHRENKARRGESIRAYVVEVADHEHEARLFAAMCNRELCLPRNKEDVRKAVEMLLADPECWEWSKSRIAQHCGTSANSVAKYQDEYATKNQIDMPQYVVTQDGRRQPARTARSTGKPAITCQGRGFESNFKGKRFRARTREAVEAKIAETMEAKESGRIRLKPAGHVLEWLLRREVLAESVSFGTGYWGTVSCIKTSSAILVPIEALDVESVCAAIGRLRVFRHYASTPDSRLVVICYIDNHSNKLLDLARADGIEFLTPDELVESLKGAEGS